MPYIKPKKRSNYDPLLQQLWDSLIANNGSLDEMRGDINYCFTKILVTILAYWHVGYSMLSSVHSIPVDVANEFKDEFMRPYEVKKKEENGQVIPLNI